MKYEGPEIRSIVPAENADVSASSPEQEHGTREDAEKMPSVSRRQFLAGLSALIAQGILPASSRATETQVELPVSKFEGLDEYEEGMEILRQQALASPYEWLALYVRLKDGGREWDFKDVQEVSHGALPTSEEFREILTEKAEHVEVVHTHPLALMYRDPEILSRARKGEAPLLAMPPSFMDISGSMVTIAPLERSLSDRVAWKVVDPAGTWDYAIDRDNSYFKKISGAIQETMQLSAELGAREDMKTLAGRHGLEGGDPRAVLEVLLEKQKELSPESRSLL